MAVKKKPKSRLSRKKINILFVIPPQTYPSRFFDKTNLRVHISIGLLQVAAVARQQLPGSSVKVLDAFTYSRASFYHLEKGVVHLGATWEEIEAEIRRLKPDMVGIANAFSSQSDNAMEVAKIVKRVDKNILTFVGGPHATVRPEEFLNTGLIDIAVLREAEYTVPEIAEHFLGRKALADILGIAYKSNGKVVQNPFRDYITDLDALPYPAYDLVDLERYFEIFRQGMPARPHIPTSRFVHMVTSRSCPYKCTFCSIHLHMGRDFRYASADYIVNHMKFLKENYGVEHVSFEDDNLTLHRKRYEDFLSLLTQEGLGVTWDTPNGTRADTFTEEMIRQTKLAGCVKLIVAPESGVQRVVDEVMKKNMNLGTVVNVARWCKKYDLDLHAFFIIGMPGETRKDIQATLNFAFMLMRKYNVKPSMGVATPLIGTDLYNEAKEKGYLVKDPDSSKNLMMGTDFPMIRTDEFDPLYLKMQWKRFYRRLAYYQALKPVYLAKRFARDPKTFISVSRKLTHFAFSSKAR